MSTVISKFNKCNPRCNPKDVCDKKGFCVAKARLAGYTLLEYAPDKYGCCLLRDELLQKLLVEQQCGGYSKQQLGVIADVIIGNSRNSVTSALLQPSHVAIDEIADRSELESIEV